MIFDGQIPIPTGEPGATLAIGLPSSPIKSSNRHSLEDIFSTFQIASDQHMQPSPKISDENPRSIHEIEMDYLKGRMKALNGNAIAALRNCGIGSFFDFEQGSAISDSHLAWPNYDPSALANGSGDLETILAFRNMIITTQLSQSNVDAETSLGRLGTDSRFANSVRWELAECNGEEATLRDSYWCHFDVESAIERYEPSKHGKWLAVAIPQLSLSACEQMVKSRLNFQFLDPNMEIEDEALEMLSHHEGGISLSNECWTVEQAKALSRIGGELHIDNLYEPYYEDKAWQTAHTQDWCVELVRKLAKQNYGYFHFLPLVDENLATVISQSRSRQILIRAKLIFLPSSFAKSMKNCVQLHVYSMDRPVIVDKSSFTGLSDRASVFINDDGSTFSDIFAQGKCKSKANFSFVYPSNDFEWPDDWEYDEFQRFEKQSQDIHFADTAFIDDFLAGSFAKRSGRTFFFSSDGLSDHIRERLTKNGNVFLMDQDCQ